ncbi:nad-binding rossmann fold oxidoreductase family protein [Diplodia corticola]|uniref:Nad-binding rossmann fold oxidoreductase family protein n=1 Tax=Diplodia corticola TaxID=236234 RepID=A0A1J9RZD8_9PEZI|nr:nad-binding rossmann fold oxidoreductase family protein [Diplodia corticola]OJD33156.1 nad-binding rossmann fold oxidoreductase family protein [Diplodia corticola]
MSATGANKRPEPRRLAIGVVGIGRIGRQHALNALHNVHRTKLVCACSPAPADLEWADEALIPYGVNVYPSFEEMIAEPGLEAVIIASTTLLHYEQVATCIKRGLHVLCEKPLSMSVAESQAIVDLASQPEYRHLKVMTAFSRRFDDSYLNAVAQIRDGRIGTPVVVRSETRDKYDDSEFYERYVMANPGIFIDTAVHDIDLTFAFLGPHLRPKSCHAIGTIARHHKLAQIADVDNATGCVEWYPPAPGAVAPISYYFFSRIMHHGFDNPTEIIGTDGALKINLHPRRDLIVQANSNGIGNDVMPDFYERYEKAFVTELRVYADAVLDGKELPYPLGVAVKGMEIASALQESLRTGKKIEWDEAGNRIG